MINQKFINKINNMVKIIVIIMQGNNMKDNSLLIILFKVILQTQINYKIIINNNYNLP